MGIINNQQLTCAWHAAVAVAVRLLLVVLGAGEALIWQPKVTTPANTALKTREGLALLQLGVSPFAGDSCHVAPLWLAVSAPVALHPVLCVVPNIISDLTAAAAVYAAASALYNRPASSGVPARGERQGEGACAAGNVHHAARQCPSSGDAPWTLKDSHGNVHSWQVKDPSSSS